MQEVLETAEYIGLINIRRNEDIRLLPPLAILAPEYEPLSRDTFHLQLVSAVDIEFHKVVNQEMP